MDITFCNSEKREFGPEAPRRETESLLMDVTYQVCPGQAKNATQRDYQELESPTRCNLQSPSVGWTDSGWARTWVGKNRTAFIAEYSPIKCWKEMIPEYEVAIMRLPWYPLSPFLCSHPKDWIESCVGGLCV